MRIGLPQAMSRRQDVPYARPVFVGGTGRSGTTIVARLLGAHPAYHMIPIEVRFLVDEGGLCDLAAGRTSFRGFRGRILGRWYFRKVRDGTTRGLHTLLEKDAIERALKQLQHDLDADRWAACGAFVHQLLDPVAAAKGATGWIEMTPPNVLAAPTLLRMFPDMQLIHAVRDGRDVACSVTPLMWGPSDLDEALDWWADRLQRGFAACASLPADRVLTVRMEDLVERDRAREYARLLAFMGLDDDPAMRAFFESSVSAERAHIGRWVDQVPPQRRAAFDAHYRTLVDRLRAAGLPVEPVDGGWGTLAG